jgi:hypothetical protein
MSPRVFLSFDFDHDAGSKLYFAGQGNRKSPAPYTIGDWSSKTALPQAVWEAQIADKIAHCHLMIVLVGTRMASASGVAKEIQFAKNADVPTFGVYVDGAGKNTMLPSGLPRNRTIGWHWVDIDAAIKQMMTEGKNGK